MIESAIALSMPAPISAAMLSEVRQQAPQGEAVWEILQSRLGMTPPECLASLGATLGHATIGMEALHRMVPDFERLPYPEAQRRKCLLGRLSNEDGRYGSMTEAMAFPGWPVPSIAACWKPCANC